MATDPRVEAVVRTYAAQSTATRQRILDYVARQWNQLSAYREADIERFIAAVLPALEAGQLQVAAITDGYLAAVEQVVLRQAVRPIGVPADVVSTLALRGVPGDVVYSRLGPTVWTALSAGADIDTAAARGLDRLQRMVATDMQLAKTHAARHVLTSKPNVVGYRRILTGSESCSLCATASTQRYRTGDLMPIHARCDCGVAPVYGNADPGRVLNAELVERLKADGTFGRTNVTVRKHAELGPQLTDETHGFTGPADLPKPAAAAARRAERTRADLAP